MVLSLVYSREREMTYSTGCAVCGAPVAKKDLCQTHYDRHWRNGTFDSLRPADWGQRSKHALWARWKTLGRRSNKTGRSPEWNDFWRFVSDVGDIPSNKAALIRIREAEPIGPSNWMWKPREPADNRLDALGGRAAYMRAWNARNPGKARQNMMKKYGMILAAYDEMLIVQGGVCKLCGGVDQRALRLSIDHCHKTHVVRGLLCSNCNTALGLLNDDPALMERAAAYVREHDNEDAA